MLEREHKFSSCRRYRFTLWRETSLYHDELLTQRTIEPGFVQIIGLNPSVADEKIDDNTIRRCIGFTDIFGYREMCMTNLFAFRATEPRDMMAESCPVGENNDGWIRAVAEEAAIILLAWGNDGQHEGRSRKVLEILSPWAEKLRTLGVTKLKEPRHPLYVSARSELLRWPTNKCCWRDHDEDGNCDKHK